MRAARGYAVMLVTALMVVLTGALSIAWSRSAEERLSRPEAAARTQALWLARSAVSRPAGAVELATDSGPALVRTRVSGRTVVAEAALAVGVARVEATLGADGKPTEWKEAFDATR